MRLIDADALRTEMFRYYPCVNEHSVKHNYSGDTLMDYEVADLIDDCIDNAPTIDAVAVKSLEAWLYEIAMNNTNTYLCDACEEIISRLDGLRVFAKERRSHHDSLCDQTEEENYDH